MGIEKQSQRTALGSWGNAALTALLFACLSQTGCVGLTGSSTGSKGTGSTSSSTPSSAAPTISITAPASGAPVTGTFSVAVNVSANTTSVQYKLDGSDVGSAIASAPFATSMSANSLSNGSHTLIAIASDSAGQTASSAAVTVSVNNASNTNSSNTNSNTTTQPAPPTVSITAPAAGAAVSGTVQIVITASTNTANVQYKLDGANIGAVLSSAPFSFSLNTTSLANGSHSLTVVATNSSGQSASSAAVSFTVSNAAQLTLPTVSITSPVSGATLSGTANAMVSASANTVSVQYKIDGANSGAAISKAPFSLSLNTATLANGAHSLAAVATNSSGQTATSAAVSFTVSNATQPTAPTVSITSPAPGATVSGTLKVSVSASSNVASVQYKIDGTNVGTAVTTAPFGSSISTSALANGSHSLVALAGNSAGQTVSSLAVSITVNNPDTVPPSISVTSPASGATVSATVAVAANASDNVGVARVEFYLDGALQTTDASSPYNWNWNTAAASNASHTILAKAYDAAGNNSSASVSVTVNNTTTGSSGGGLTASGPISLSGQNGTVIQNLHVTNPNGDCISVTNSTNITIRQSEIGPCKGNGIVVSGGSTINVFDNYIHPEGALAGCCDVTDGIFANGTQSLTVQGNVIAYGEANIEAQNQTNLKVTGNFFLNPRGGADSRGQNVQVFYGSSNVLVQNNYALASTDTTKYAFAEDQEDSINFGGSPSGSSTTGIVAQNNYITGGHSASGCGLIADTAANNAQFLSNTLVNTGQCGIGIADGTTQVVDSNKILNTTPVSGGGNTAIYVWKVTSSDPACGPVQVSNNVASAIQTNGSPNSYWSGGAAAPLLRPTIPLTLRRKLRCRLLRRNCLRHRFRRCQTPASLPRRSAITLPFLPAVEAQRR